MLLATISWVLLVGGLVGQLSRKDCFRIPGGQPFVPHLVLCLVSALILKVLGMSFELTGPIVLGIFTIPYLLVFFVRVKNGLAIK